MDRRIVRRGRRRINFPVSQSDEIPAEVRTMLANRDARAAQRNNNVNSDRLPVPPIIDCQQGKCCKTHFVKHGLHYDKGEWENFRIMSIELKNIGVCRHCQKNVKGKRGMTKENRMWEHVFEECMEYPYSKVVRRKK